MVDPTHLLTDRVRSALLQISEVGSDPVAILVHRSKHADYQTDVALSIASAQKLPVMLVADSIVKHLQPDDVIASTTVSGSGFININLSNEYVIMAVERMSSDRKFGISDSKYTGIAVVDYSAPNLAKEMHVGHLRSTIIGDSLVRILKFAGYEVIKQNHIGDWGTPFGMLIEELVDRSQNIAETQIAELSEFYRAARTKFEQDMVFAERSRKRVVLLQGGDAYTLSLWTRLVEITTRNLDTLYRRLNVLLDPNDLKGESQYNHMLQDVVSELQSKGIARESDGAICAFPFGYFGRKDGPLPLIVKKRDGGFTYATTDLAALRHRVRDLGATRIIYVVGSPQTQHLAMIFRIARMARWTKENTIVEHATFGSVLGSDKKMFKSKLGQAVNLDELLDQAERKALEEVALNTKFLTENEKRSVASAVAIGAVKFADLSTDRQKDYVFSWDRMLKFDGNTAPYIMYAYARISSLLTKFLETNLIGEIERSQMQISSPNERALFLELLQFPGAIERSIEQLQPHRICHQLYVIATAFNSFYNSCRILDAHPDIQKSRLKLCFITSQILRQGLELLGISTLERM